MDYFLNNSQKDKGKNNLIVSGLSIYFLSLPLGAISFAQGSALKLVAIIPIAAFFLRKEQTIRLNKVSGLQLVYTFLLLISAQYSIGISLTIQRVESNVMFCILLILMGSVLFEKAEIEKLRKALVWSSRITCILVLVFGTTSENRLLFDGVIKEDPNYLNAYLLFGVVYSLQILISSASLRLKSMAVMELLFYVYVCVATGSRSGALCLLGGALTVFIFKNVKGDKLREIAIKIGLLVLIALIISIVIKYIPNDVLERFQINSILKSNGTDRFEFWGWAIDIFKNSFIGRQFFGFGAGTIENIFGMYGHKMVVSHNIFIEQLMEGGVITLIVYCSLVISAVLKAKVKRDLFTLAVLIGLIILSTAASLYTFKPYWNAIIFSSLLVAKDKKEQIFDGKTEL